MVARDRGVGTCDSVPLPRGGVPIGDSVPLTGGGVPIADCVSLIGGVLIGDCDPLTGGVPTGDSVPLMGREVPTGDSVWLTGWGVPTSEFVAPAVLCGIFPGGFEALVGFSELVSEFWCSGFCIEAGSTSRADAAAVKAGLNIEAGFPETLASGFSIEAGMEFNFEAAAATDGLATEAGGVSSGVAVSFTAPVVCAVFDTTAASGSVV